MAKEKFQFYLVLSNEAPNRESFQKSLEDMYTNGVTPIEWHEDVFPDEKHENAVLIVSLLRCEERWRGASKRFLRKTKFTYRDQKIDGLPCFG